MGRLFLDAVLDDLGVPEVMQGSWAWCLLGLLDKFSACFKSIFRNFCYSRVHVLNNMQSLLASAKGRATWKHPQPGEASSGGVLLADPSVERWNAHLLPIYSLA